MERPLNTERFQHSPSGHIVEQWYEGKPYMAFVPDPLPPGLTWTWDLALALSEADRAIGELAGVGHNLPNPELLLGPFITREAVLSSRIEGTQTGIADLYAYQAGQLPIPGLERTPPESDAQEVVNYVHALRYGLERVETLPVSRRLMRELHERLMTGVRGQHATMGQFRRDQNWIGRRGINHPSGADFVPPPVQQMQVALDDLEQFINESSSLPPLVRIALIHYQFETIHPFGDGNGRIGRLLISLLLVYWKILPLPLLYLSAYFERLREEYCDLLFAVSERGTWNEWIAFFLRGVAEQSRDASGRAKRLQDLQGDWRRQVQQARVTDLLHGLIDFLFEQPILAAN